MLSEQHDDTLVCGDCQLSLVDPQPACRACGARLPSGVRDAGHCPRCAELRLRFAAVVALGHYDGLLRTLVLRTKQSTEHGLARALAKLLSAERGPALRELHVDVVVPIPMHWTRRVWRGVNSPDLLASELGRGLKIPVAPFLLRRIRATEPQADMSPNQRFKNVRGAFAARRHADLKGARVLLADDIMTTGATASEAARMLRKAGAASVVVVVVARAGD
jgi:ComF family protein